MEIRKGLLKLTVNLSKAEVIIVTAVTFQQLLPCPPPTLSTALWTTCGDAGRLPTETGEAGCEQGLSAPGDYIHPPAPGLSLRLSTCLNLSGLPIQLSAGLPVVMHGSGK